MAAGSAGSGRGPPLTLYVTQGLPQGNQKRFPTRQWRHGPMKTIAAVADRLHVQGDGA